MCMKLIPIPLGQCTNINLSSSLFKYCHTGIIVHPIVGFFCMYVHNYYYYNVTMIVFWCCSVTSAYPSWAVVKSMIVYRYIT